MTLHRNAKLGLAGRLALVQAIGEGMSIKAAELLDAYLKRAQIVQAVPTVAQTVAQLN